MEITLNVTLFTALIALLLTSVIAFCSVFAGLGFVFNLFLRPMKENQARMENRMDRIESKLDQLINASTK